MSQIAEIKLKENVREKDIQKLEELCRDFKITLKEISEKKNLLHEKDLQKRLEEIRKNFFKEKGQQTNKKKSSYMYIDNGKKYQLFTSEKDFGTSMIALPFFIQLQNMSIVGQIEVPLSFFSQDTSKIGIIVCEDEMILKITGLEEDVVSKQYTRFAGVTQGAIIWTTIYHYILDLGSLSKIFPNKNLLW